ncbi:MAG: cytochrome c biogenesis protein ResB [Verrucomicrobiae bacterium]|nr:cytochrome c biogenesis protein ResB [Verrucomicrobiae bacterium]
MLLDKIINFLTSMRLTVVCLALAMVLVFIGTLAQVDKGIFIVQREFFQSLIVISDLRILNYRIPIIFPGGYLIGLVLLLNLFASHFKRFGFQTKKLGLLLTHFGLLVLLVGQLLIDHFHTESNMRLVEGQSLNYSESYNRCELALIKISDPQTDTVVAISEPNLYKGNVIRNPHMPFQVKVHDYFPNSRLENLPEGGSNAASTLGSGRQIRLIPVPPETKTDTRNAPSAIIEIIGDNAPNGTWLASFFLDRPQEFTVGNEKWALVLRPERYYKSYFITLIDFTHEKYPGTDIPKNFSSRVKITNPQTGEEREALIYMNNPLRYGGETYYQGSFDPNDDRVSILQVVRNPAWTTPYIACILVGLGMVIHFIINLGVFVNEQRKK